MAQFLQIILIHLAVSCDNVGVIALATKGLPEQTAAPVRRIGIGLSLVLKIVFIAVIGALLEVTWLHIRIIGGVMLLYVTFQMVGPHEQAQPKGSAREGGRRDSLRGAIVSIVAADISMSLDNVVAVLGVVSADGAPLDRRDYLLVIGGLVICTPLLLWCSGTIARLMERFPLLTDLCAGYLVYTAIRILLEDESIKLFCEAASFSFSGPAAILCGGLMAVYGCTARRRQLSRRARWGTLSLYLLVLVSGMLMVGGLSFLRSTGFAGVDSPIEFLIARRLQSGAHAVYLLGMESEVLCFCTAVMAGMRAGGERARAGAIFLQNLRGMGGFALLYFTVVTAGFTYTFGFGDMPVAEWLCHLLLLTALLLTYPAVFSVIAAVTRSRPLSVSLGLVYLFLESAVTAVCLLYDGLLPLAGMLPKYHLSTHVVQPLTPILCIRILLICALFIGACYAAVCRVKGRRGTGGSAGWEPV